MTTKEIDITPFVDYAIGLWFLAQVATNKERAKIIAESQAFKDWQERCKGYKERASIQTP